MREIIFRGKRIDNGEWIEGSAINTQYDVKGNKHIYIGVFKMSERYPLMKFIEWFEVVPETVGQYTGLNDKNGKKIFEGDIVNVGGAFKVVRFGKHEIECCGCCYESHSSVGFYLESDDEEIDAYERMWDKLYVIGNIHDNPDLLKGGAE